MTLLRRYVVWIILALILVAEGGVTFVLMGKQKDARQKLDKLATERKTLRGLQGKDLRNPERKKKLEVIRDHLVSQRGQCVLFFWARDQQLESLFPDPRLGERPREPWDTDPRGLSDFKYSIQTVYNEAVDKLLDQYGDKLLITRAIVPFASDTGFTKPDVTMGDIYGEMKEFWIRKAVVELAGKHKLAELDPILITRKSTARAAGDRAMMVAGAAQKKATLLKPIAVEITVRASYPNFSGFVADLLSSPLMFRLRSVTQCERGRSQAKQRRAGRGGRGAPRPLTPQEAMMMDVPPARAAERRLEGGLMPPGLPPPAGVGAGERRLEGEAGVAGVPLPPASEAAPQLVQMTLSCEVLDFQVDLARARFTGSKLAKKPELRQWLEQRIAELKPSPERSLWAKTLKALDDPARVKAEGNSIEITFRPKEHFAQDKPPYTQSFGYEGVEVEFRLVTAEPNESSEGVAKAKETL